MGMEVGIGTNPYKTKQELKDYQGNQVAKATISSAKVKQRQAAKKKKLNYNHRRISRQITMSRTTSGIRRVITRARDQVVDLLRKQMSGKYDETDVRHAIIHARKMERVARKKKKLNYNHRRISRQITMSRTTSGIRRVITRARDQVVDLLRKQMSGKYDETDVRHAIIHARKMERVARKKKKHLEQEEKAKATGKALVEKGEGKSDEEKELEKAADGLSKEELEKLIAEYEEFMQEMEKTSGMDEVMKEYMGATEVEMSPEQLDQLRKKHRSDEMKDIVEADMKYLKALFNKLAREQQENANGNPSVSLELEGVEIPIPQETTEAAMAAAEMVEGANVDVMV